MALRSRATPRWTSLAISHPTTRMIRAPISLGRKDRMLSPAFVNPSDSPSMRSDILNLRCCDCGRTKGSLRPRVRSRIGDAPQHRKLQTAFSL